jgi:hypothetical protein
MEGTLPGWPESPQMLPEKQSDFEESVQAITEALLAAAQS